MPQQKNHLMRVLVPLVIALSGIGIAFAVLTNSANTRKQGAPTSAAPASADPSAAQPSGEQQAVGAEQDSQPQGGEPESPAEIDAAAGQPTLAATPGVQPENQDIGAAQGNDQDAGQPQSNENDRNIDGLHALVVPEVDSFTSLGTSDPDAGTDERLELIFSTRNTGLTALNLAKYRTSYKPGSSPVSLQHEIEFGPYNFPFVSRGVVTPFGANGATINGAYVSLTGWPKHVWRETAPGSFEAVVVDEGDNQIVRFTRTYRVTPNSYDVVLEQRAENLTDERLEIIWKQNIQGDLPIESTGYGGEKRRFRFGYMLREELASFNTVISSGYLWSRGKVHSIKPTSSQDEFVRTLWPNTKALDQGHRLVWSGSTNRYFGIATHPARLSDTPQVWFTEIDAMLLHTAESVQVKKPFKAREIALGITMMPVQVAPGEIGAMDLGIYAGPLSAPIMQADANADELDRLNLFGLIVYSFGGPCAMCTFSWLTGGLFSLLSMLHNYVVHDWALSIVMLVLIVRTTLHPVTKWSQIRVQKFSKQMQGMAPKQKKIQEKFGHDKKRQQEEMAKLWREEGINPAGALGCLPMFLQTPVWIALYAMLYFNVDLRHEAAFFGVFQGISGGAWGFMADMSAADGFIPLPFSFYIPLMGDIGSFNILPLALGFVFYAHQKYMTPPTSASMTPEQQSQQKMMKIMMVVMFPVMMYNAPSGLALYFIVNSSIAIIESRHIRAHIDKHDLHNTEKKSRKKNGFMQRLMEAAEARKQMLENNGGKMPKRAKGPGKQPQASKPDKFERRYKKKK